ncbi:MAG: Fic family protein [Acidobacteria bacterium]|nr:Fic family protein [Acidobacteriota bacterium]MBI3425751.1 Fic family protein [Acidobacteriota bacterium]
MELPIFNDNLKSSATWNQRLAQAQAARTSSAAAVRAEQVAQLGRRAGWASDKAALARLYAGVELVSGWAAESAPTFGMEGLLLLHRTLTGATTSANVLRQTAPLPLNALHDPTPAVLLPRLLDNAFDWFSTDGFNELHAVEQAAVVFLRLLDLHPFSQYTEITALLAASYYIERAGLPPLFVFNDEVTLQRYAVVTETAFRMLTQPLVEFFAEQLMRVLQLGGQTGEAA